MRVLALETSTLAGGVALLDGDRLVAEYVLDVSVMHSERLIGAVDRVLGDAGWDRDGLTGLAVAIGPGSFTGLRVGVSTAKGLALGLGVPLAAVPTLDAMAACVPWAMWPVCPVLDARKGEVYASLYRRTAEGPRREWEYEALGPEELDARLDRLGSRVIVCGDGARLVRSAAAVALPPPARVPSPATVGALGVERLRLGDTVKPADLAPLYLRPSEAELKRRGDVR
jgi:tRNA threonylcarbamoyladenosine biosynthesis protein TsaB